MKTKLLLLAWLLASLNLLPETALAGPGHALSFTANNQFVNVINPTPLASNYTFSAWVYLSEGGNLPNTRSGILSSTNLQSNGALNSVELLVRSGTSADTDSQYLELGRSGAFNGTGSTNTVPTNQWVHVAVTVSTAKAVNYYINGAAAGAWDASGLDVTINTNLCLANNALSGRKFRGMLDEVQIWSRVLGQTEIQTNMNRADSGSDTNLIAYWHFDNSATNSAPAYPGVADGTLVTTPVYTNSGVPFVPDASTAAASDIGLTNATLNGTVNPGNLATAAWFQWGATTNYGNLIASTNLSATNASFALATNLTGLILGQTYHYRLVASNSAGITWGDDVAWTDLALPPTVTTLAATSVRFTNATVNATVNPNGLPTTAWFEWGTDTGYGNVTTGTNLNAGTANVALAAVLAGLSRGQTIHYRAVATNAGGQTTGGDLTFTTRNGTNAVTTLADSGAGSLRQVIADSLAGEMIVFATNGTITLTNGELLITNSLTFAGPSTTNLSISGNTNSRVFNISRTNAVVIISDVTLCNGKAANDGHGGGVYNVGTLTLSNCTLNANAAGTNTSGHGGNGGGIYNAGSLTLSACTLSANSAGNGADGNDSSNGNGGSGNPGGNGGGVFNAGTLTLSACTFSLNTAGQGGNGGRGGISYGNSGANGSGGSGGNGGGVFNNTNASLATLRSSLFALNAAGTGGTGGGSAGSAGSVGTDPDLSGKFTSLGHNLVGITGNSTGLINGVNGDLIGTAAAPINALLGPLANNGGATFTLALLPGSQAIEAGDDTLTGTDQRGSVRKSGQHVDIGAYELDAAALGYSAPSLGNVACTVSNLASGLSSATFAFSVNPNGLNTTAWIDYGVSTSYGGTSGALYLGCANVSVATNLTLSGLQPGSTLHYHITASSPAGTTTGADHTITTTAPGDLDGDGVVSTEELNTIGQNYWGTTTNSLTGLTSAGPGQFTFGLTNAAGLNFTVLMSTNLSDWTVLTNASPEFLFTDSAATNAVQRFYRLRWP